MNRVGYLSIIIVILLIGFFAWSPWLTESFTKARAVTPFNKTWESVADGCGMNCEGCGARSARRVPFGAWVVIEYACGLIPEDSSQYHDRTEVFVSAFGTVHGYPPP